jgi:hypothetical protein
MLSIINYIGKRGKLIDGSIITTKWICPFIPLFPLASFRFWLKGGEPNFLYQGKLIDDSVAVEIPLDWINITIVYSVYLFLAALAAYLFQNNPLVLTFSIAFVCVYSFHIFLKYNEKKLHEIDKSQTFQCDKCKAKFHILKLNIAHDYFQCPKCKTVNMI